MRISAIACAALFLTMNACAHQAEQAALRPAVIYVAVFQPEVAAASGTGIRPLHALATGLHARRTDDNAEKLSGAVVQALNDRNMPAQVLSPGPFVPNSGWIVRGTFYSLDTNNRLLSVPFVHTTKGPNVDVTVTIADAAKDPFRPIAVIGTDAALKGQESNFSLYPYAIAAKFVIHKVEGDKSLNALAGQIADKIIEAHRQLER
ncbi:MAG TPA: hypothetical protein VL574_16635 [Stellaceae bacterium]|jgi:hypothetical protein|nr:hypothetical protein [Stellaceae bacterium]